MPFPYVKMTIVFNNMYKALGKQINVVLRHWMVAQNLGYFHYHFHLCAFISQTHWENEIVALDESLSPWQHIDFFIFNINLQNAG